MAFGENLGFGMFGGAGLSPLDRRRARDPRYAYSQALLKSGGDTSAVYSPVQGLARVGSGLVGGWLASEANKDWDEKEGMRAKAIADALKMASGSAAEGDVPAQAPNMQGAIQMLSRDPLTQDVGMRLANEEMAFGRQRAASREDREASQGFTREMAGVQNNYNRATIELQQAFAAAQQDKSLAAQERLQRANQAFQAAQADANRAFQIESAGPIAAATTAATLEAQNRPTVIQTPQGPATVPAAAAAPLARAQAEPPTEAERLATGFADRMAAQSGAFEKIGEKGYPSTLTGVAPETGFGQWVQRQVQSPEQQRYMYAAMDWIRAKLRKESGAAIGEKEMADEWRTYFPVPGDTPEAIADKARARAQAELGMRQTAGSKYRPSIVPEAEQPRSGVQNIPLPDLEAEMRRRGLLK